MPLPAECHDEVVRALKAIGDARRGEAVRLDRGSQLLHLGVPVPALRARVKQGFSFSGRADALAVWNALWQQSPVGDVLFAAIEALAPAVRRRPAPEQWTVVRGWIDRVDNWCHADALAGLTSRLLEAFPEAVMPQLEAWNEAEALWPRRLSITSLVHYTGRNAVFLGAEHMLPLLARCVDDHRPHIAQALGWVLRETLAAHPQPTVRFIERHARAMSAVALRRAVEKRPPEERARWLALRER